MRRLPRLSPPRPRAGGGAGTVERASADDLMELASDVGRAPMQVGAVLLLDGLGDIDEQWALRVIGERTASVRRLRQRLVRVPLGCGRPIWIDQPDFDIADHVGARRCPGPGDERALLGVAARLLATRLPVDRPLWSATFVDGLEDGDTALIIVFHHVLADGIGGLAMLARLVDGVAVTAAPADFPRPAPTRMALLADLWGSRVRALGRLPGGIRRLTPALAELGAMRGTRARRTALNRPTTGERELAVARVELEPARALAHLRGATVNDVVLMAATAVLTRALDAIGEQVEELVVSVPVAGRTGTTADRLGNQVGVMPLALPVRGPRAERLGRIAEISAMRRTTGRGASALLAVPVLRALSSLGVLAPLIDRQSMINTLVTNLRGPGTSLTFAGATIRQISALSTVAGNVTVAFATLSYAGTLAITVVTDPHWAPPAADLARLLEGELRSMTAGQTPPPPPASA